MTKIVVFDWDDTFLFSSELYELMKEQQCKPIECKLTPTQKEDIMKIDTFCTNVLKSLIASSIDVIIITNADDGWIAMTGPVYLPLLYKYIMETNIPTISAASLYKSSTSCTTEWKYFTLLKFFEESPVLYEDMLSVGDSNCEKQATLWIESNTAADPNKKLKFPRSYATIKMADRPTASKILSQFKNIYELLKLKYNL